MVGLKLLIDHREKDIEELLEGVCEEIDFAQLPVGDYLLVLDTEAIVVERKTARALARCFVNGQETGTCVTRIFPHKVGHRECF